LLADSNDPRWVTGLDHTDNKGHGIAEDDIVQDIVYDSLANHALNETF
jgi:hypothetical protein